MLRRRQLWPGPKNRNPQTGEAAVLANAKITLAQAIAAAELSAGGKSVGSGIENLDGTAFFEVEVLKKSRRASKKVLVDTQSGQVVKTVTADNSQQDNEQYESGQENDQEGWGARWERPAELVDSSIYRLRLARDRYEPQPGLQPS